MSLKWLLTFGRSRKEAAAIFLTLSVFFFSYYITHCFFFFLSFLCSVSTVSIIFTDLCYIFHTGLQWTDLGQIIILDKQINEEIKV